MSDIVKDCKWIKHKDEKYLSYIREKGCIICGKRAEPHHYRRARRNDYMAIPLCRMHHTECHALEKTPWAWEEVHNLNPYWVIINLLGEYLDKEEE